MSAGPPRASTRAVAVLIWAAHVAGLLLFLGLVLALPPRMPDAPRDVLLGAAVVTSAIGIALSRVLPGRIGARQAAGHSDVLAMTRLIVAWAICELVAMFPLVAFLLTHDGRLLGALAVDAVALLALFPSEERFALLGGGAAATPPPSRMAR